MQSIFEVESIKTNFAAIIARVEVVQETWNKIRNDFPQRSAQSVSKLLSDKKDRHYNSAVALFDIIRFLHYGVREHSGCAQYYWTPEEKFGLIPTGDIHAKFQRSHCSFDYVEYQKKQITHRLLKQYTGFRRDAFEAQLESASGALDTIHTALIKLLKSLYQAKLVNELTDHSIRCHDTSEYRKKFHKSCYDEYKRYELDKPTKASTAIATKPLQYPNAYKVNTALVPKTMNVSNKKRRKNVICDDEDEEDEIVETGESETDLPSNKRRRTEEEQLKTQNHDEATYPQIVVDAEVSHEEKLDNGKKMTEDAATYPQIIGGGKEGSAKKKKRADLDDSDDSDDSNDSDSSYSGDGKEDSVVATGDKSVAKTEVELKLPHTTVVDLHFEDGPAVDMPEDTIVDKRVEKLSEDVLYANWKVKLENAKSDLVLSFKDMLSISISGSCQTVAPLVPISSINLGIKTKDVQPNITREDAFLQVLNQTGLTASKYNELQTLILKALLNDPTSIRFCEHEYEYLSEGLISYCSQCKEFAKITMTSLVNNYPDDPDMDKLTAALYQANQSIVKTLNGFVAYIMRDFVKGSIEKGVEFIEKHLNAVASCNFVYLEVGTSRRNLENIVHDKNKIKEVGENILREIKELSSSAIGHQSSKKLKNVLLPPPPLLIKTATTTKTTTNIESSKQSHVVDDYDGEVDELIALCDKVQRAALTTNYADSQIDVMSVGDESSTDDADFVSQKSGLLYIITAYAKRHIKDTKKEVYCFTNEVFKSLKAGEFFSDITLFEQKYVGDFEVHEENGDKGTLDSEEFKLFNYPDEDDIEFFFPCR